MRSIVLIAHNLRSAHNVGSLLRTADGLAVNEVYLTGYTPYPIGAQDDRLPHLAQKTDRAISKTALGAEKTVAWSHNVEVPVVINALRNDGYQIIGLEQAPRAVPLPEFKSTAKVAIIVGREVEGIEPEVLEQCDQIVEIPMQGQKESLNVVQAAAMALYQLRFMV
jgi:23S rRNA (guanosine2251-2'-O)-methyltransferase